MHNTQYTQCTIQYTQYTIQYTHYTQYTKHNTQYTRRIQYTRNFYSRRPEEETLNLTAFKRLDWTGLHRPFLFSFCPTTKPLLSVLDVHINLNTSDYICGWTER